MTTFGFEEIILEPIAKAGINVIDKFFINSLYL